MKNRILSLFSAFQNRNFGLYMASQSLSGIGTCMQQVAVGWLLYRLTNSNAWLGWLGFCANMPLAIFITGAGVLVDRFDRRRLLLVTQGVAFTQAFLLGLLVWFNVIGPLHILLLALLSGILESIALPARQTLIPALLRNQDDLGNALGLNLSIINLTRFIGPMLAGRLVAVSGEAACLLIISLSFLGTMGSLGMIRLPPRTERATKIDFWSHWKEGLGYAYNHRAIREILELVMITSLVVTPCMTLTPAIVRVLNGGPVLLGALTAAGGFGAILGAFALPLFGIRAGPEIRRLVPWSAVVLTLSTILFSLTRSIPLAWCLAAIGGLSITLLNVASNTWLQLTVPDVKRGRVMSLLAWAMLGSLPVGSLLTGFIADRVGVYPLILLSGCLGLVAVLLVGLGSLRDAANAQTDAFATIAR